MRALWFQLFHPSLFFYLEDKCKEKNCIKEKKKNYDVELKDVFSRWKALQEYTSRRKPENHVGKAQRKQKG